LTNKQNFIFVWVIDESFVVTIIIIIIIILIASPVIHYSLFIITINIIEVLTFKSLSTIDAR